MLHLLIFSIVPVAFSQSTECGSLITYRQFDDLLASAPKCLRLGCQTDTVAFSMSSSCASTSPCYPLWNLLRDEWQQDWCESCSRDIACRITGWPVLNGTSACARSPHEWLFSNSVGGCCANNEEPFDLAAWTGRMCNGSEWRQPFEFYGGMAREDWVEWMQPWNWTVHQQNDTDRNFTQVVCDSARSMQIAFIVDNFVSAGWAAFELFGYWLCCICAWRVAMDESTKEAGTWRRSLTAGLVTGGLYLVTNFATSILWDLTPGYQQMPRGYVGLLLCARPSVLGFLSLFAIWGRGRVERSRWDDDERERLRRREGTTIEPDDEAWFDTPRVKEWRRWFGGVLRKLSSRFGSDGQNSPVTDRELADGKLTAQQLLTGFALTIGVSELVLQVSSVYSIWKTATIGGDKGFYSRYALLPYYGGSAAARMYGGALLHCVFLFPSTIGLVGIAWSHAKDSEYQRVRRRVFADEGRIWNLEEYYNTRPVGREQTEPEKAKARAMFREQKLLEHSVFGNPHPSFWKQTWTGTKKLYKRLLRRLQSPLHPRPEPPNVPETQPSADRRAFSAKLHTVLVNLTVTIMEPLSHLIESARRDPQPTTQTNRISRHLRLAMGRTLSFRPLQRRISASLGWANEQKRIRAEEIAREEAGPDQNRFNEIKRHLEEEAGRRTHRAWVPTRRSLIFFVTGTFVTINYISQWLFWSGYVETAGKRWCPPNVEFSIEKGIWAAIAAVALLVSVLMSIGGESGAAPGQ